MQALYYSLRAFFLERRDIERSKDHDATSKNEEDAQKHAEVLMSTLRKTHPVLWSRLEAILEDLIIRFRPSYEAELLVTIKALLEKAKSKLEQTSNDATPDNKGGLLESIRASLIKISTKFFNKEKPDSQKGRKTLLFEKKWHAPYTHDFVDKQTGPDGVHQGPGSIDELIVKLEEWKAKLEYHVSHVPNKCFLQETSPSLSWHSGQSSDYWAGSCDSASLTLSNSQHDYPSTLDNVLYEATRSSAMVAKASSDAVHMAFRNEGLGGHEGGGSAMIEIPGQYAPTSSNVLDLRPLPELHAKLVHFHQTLEVISTPAKQEQTVRQITMIGSDGKSYKFLLQLAIPYWTRTDERSAQLQYIMGKILKRNVQAHRRCLSVQPNAVIPVAQRMRMTANEPSYCTLDSVAYHAEGPSISDLAIFFENEVAKRIADIEKSKNDDKTLPDDVKLDVYRCISQHFVPPNIMSKYMMDTIPSIERLMQFRKMFASQLSANSFLQHAFAIIERTPSRFMFCTSTGRILAQDFRFQYNQGMESVFFSILSRSVIFQPVSFSSQ
jgi:transformation/transcription domain-associated protein